MEKEKSQNGRRGRRLLIALGSMLLCLSIIGVAVYAALQQSVQLTNTITVTTAGQAKAIVTAYEAQVEGTGAVATAPTDEPTWGSAILTKAESEDQKTGALTPIVFSQSEGKNVWAYKITVENKSTGAVTVNVTSSTESNTEIDVYAGESMATLSAVANASGVNLQKAGLAADDTVTFYIFVVANTALGDMTAATSQPFNIDVTVTAE